MKKIKYNDESNLSFISCFYMATIVFGIIILCIIDIILKGFSKKNIINTLELFAMFLTTLFVGLKTKIDVKENQERHKFIKENGKNYSGKITGIIEDDESSDENTYYKLSVKYFNEEQGKYKYFITPTINIKPKNIDNMICDVYVYENEAIADNFSGYEVTSTIVNIIKILAIILIPITLNIILKYCLLNF